MGLLGKVMRKKRLTRRMPESSRKRKLGGNSRDHRPYFTYWVTTVQVAVLFISLLLYGFGPLGVDLYKRSNMVSRLFSNDFSGILSFGGQEMSGNVGKYGETQAQICPYSQQTLKVWLRARANLQLVNHTLIGQIEAPKQLLARLARICPILVWGRADRPCQVELNALEKEGGEPPSVSSQKNWSFRIIYQLDNI